MQYSPQQPAPRHLRRREIFFEPPTRRAITPELDGDRRRHRPAAQQRVKGEAKFPDQPIALLEPPSALPPRFGQPVLQPLAIVVLEQRQDPRDPSPVIIYVDFTVFLSRANYFITQDLGYFMLRILVRTTSGSPLGPSDPLYVISRLWVDSHRAVGGTVGR